MAWVIAGGVAALAPAVYKGIKGIGQTSKANAMKPINPGYQMNTAVINNAKTLSDNYGNYQLPGYGQAQNNIDSNFQNAFSTGVQGATSGGDILDLATRMAYGKNNALNELSQQNAVGKQTALNSYLNANAAAGQQYVDKNAYERDMYNGQLKEKAALTESGAANTFGAIDQIAGIGAKYAFSKAGDLNTQGDPNAPVGSPAYNKWLEFSKSGGNTNTFK